MTDSGIGKSALLEKWTTTTTTKPPQHIISNTMATSDPRISNLTPYQLNVESAQGLVSIIPFSGNWAIFYPKDKTLLRKEGHMEINDWPATLADTHRTAIVTEEVGLHLANPENAGEWLGRVVGPVGLKPDYITKFSKPIAVDARGEWVMYKDVTPSWSPSTSLKKVAFEPDQSLPPFYFI